MKSFLGSILVARLLLFRTHILLCLGLFIMVLTVFSCKEDNPNPTPTDEITLSSKTLGTQPYYSEGYSFERQVFYPRISSGTEIDIYLNELLKLSGEPTGVQFSTNIISETNYGFYLNAEFDNLTDAENYFNNYTTAVFPSFVSLTDTVKAYQVYTFRTWKSNFVKFVVKDIRTYKEGNIADYLEVDIKYFIQRDGSVNLVN
jgi:hypothetical protein